MAKRRQKECSPGTIHNHELTLNAIAIVPPGDVVCSSCYIGAPFDATHVPAAGLIPMTKRAQATGPRGLVDEQAIMPTDMGTPLARDWVTVGMPIVVLGWIMVVLFLDADGSLTTQRVLGALTWLLFVVALRRQTASVRAQALIVVLLATVVEYTSSPLLNIYIYRLDNVPAYVPPGHGLVYLSAMAIGGSDYVRAHERTCVAAVVAVGGIWAAWGLFGSDQVDVLGAIWFGCLVAFLLRGPRRPLYVGAFVVVSYLEIIGTTLGVWQWQPRDLAGLVPIGNPPSGAAGGYCWFDFAALLASQRLHRWLQPARGSAAWMDADLGIWRLIAVSGAVVSRCMQSSQVSARVQLCPVSASTRASSACTDHSNLGSAAPWRECWSTLGIAMVPEEHPRDRVPPIRGPCNAGGRWLITRR